MRKVYLLLVGLVLSFSVLGQSQADVQKAEDLGLSEYQILQLQQYATQQGYSTGDGSTTSESLNKVENAKNEIAVSEELDNKNLDQLREVTKKDETVVSDIESGLVVEDKVQDKKQVFGHNLFRKGNIDIFERKNVVRASDSYILSKGDEISVSIWGYSDFNRTYLIQDDGSISAKRVGKVYLQGLEFGDAKKLIEKRFSSYFDLKNSEIKILLNYSRDITVNIVGEVNNPGSYKLKGYHTAFNALFAANGINKLGSYRMISIKRNGETINQLDLYKFLMAPTKSKDIYLEDNDYIIVEPKGNVVSIEGEVKRPMNYEMLEGETVEDLFTYCGGINSIAYTKNIQVTRIENNEQKVYDIDYEESKGSEISVLKDGDQLLIRAIPEYVENFVEIEGAVKIPGRYEFTDSMRILDLIKLAKGLMYDSYTERVYLVRTDEDLKKHYNSFDLNKIVDNPNNDNNILLNKFDKITVFSKNDFLDIDSVIIRGAVRKPGKYVFGEGMNLKDILYLSGGLERQAAISRIEVSRIIDYNNDLNVYRPSRTIVKVIEVDFNMQVDEKDALFELKPMDQLFVRTEPIYEEHQNVTLLGELNYPGVYTKLTKNDRLLDLLERAGGYTEWAFLEGAKLYRAEDDLGYMFIDMKKLGNNPKSEYNYILKSGDTLVIPKINDLVSITGTIEYPLIDSIGKINAPFYSHKRAKFYVKKFGVDFDRGKGAVRRKTTVVLPNGIVKKTKNFGLFKIYPRVEKGSIVVVNSKEEKPEEIEEDKEPVNWNEMFESFTIKVTGLLTLYFLVDRLGG